MTGAGRTRVLFVAEAVTLAHVGRAYALATGLDLSAFDVHAAWDPRFNRLLGAMPFAYRPIRSMPSELFLKRLSRGLPMHDTATLRGYVEEDLAAIEAVRPDVVVSDFRLSMAASARIARVPLVTIANAYWSPYGKQSFLFRHYRYPLSRVIGTHAARALFRAFRPIGFAAHTRPLNRVLRERGLPPIGRDIRIMYTYGDYTAYADLPELVPLDGLPPTHRFIGPVVWSPAAPLPRWWNELPADRPVVYVTLGSSGVARLLPAVLRALACLPVTVIAATAGRVRIDAPPANAFVADFLPGDRAAARASLVVYNGGSPTTSQALAAGVPVLGLVGNNMDQQLNMEAVCRAGAGVIRAVTTSEGGLREAVATLLKRPEFQPASEALARRIRAGRPAADLGALLVEAVM